MPPVWICAVPGVGVVFSLVLFATIRGWEQRDVEKRTMDLAHEHVSKLEVTILRSMEVLYSIASLYEAEGRMEHDQFRRFTQRALQRQPELQALSWNPVVPNEARLDFERAASAAGPGFQIREKDGAGNFRVAGTRAQYVPVCFIEPMDRNAAALGYDLGSDSNRLVSIELARDTGRPVATAPIQLAQGPDNQAGFLVLLPVYAGTAPGTVAERQARLSGFAVAVFRVNDLVSGVFQDLKRKGMEARLFDEARTGMALFNETGGSRTEGQERVSHFEVAGRKWALTFHETGAFVSAQSRTQSWLVLAGGLLFTLLSTAYFYGAWRRTQQVAQANAALQDEIAVRQRAEAEAAAANQAKSDFLASMSHEIRTPLNAILGYTQLMQRDLQLPAEQRDGIAGISASGRHLLGLINEILDLSKIEAGRMEVNTVDFDLIDLADGLAATFRPLCSEKRIGFRLEAGGLKSCCLSGDEGKLRQVLINLLGNAVKFTSAGEICLQIKQAGEGKWLFEVFDTGLGIPEEEREDIFKPFHQGSGARHQGGTGLGLAIAKRQVELLGGELELQSERGAGSRFFFTVPFAPAQGEVRVESVQPVLRLAAGSRVSAMVVDDSKENREVLGGMLAAIGCQVTYAESGESALELAGEVKPDMVFVDLLMPGLSGVETARQLTTAGQGRGLKIVAHTASALSRHRDEAMAAGCVDFLPKPIYYERLYHCLERHLGVVFETVGLVGEAELPAQLGAQEVELPGELSARLTVAAELHSTTALKFGLQELRQHGPKAVRLADEIRLLMRGYDMDGILRLIARVVAPTSVDPDAANPKGVPHA